MEVNNPLSGDFLLRYPFQAARVLEQISPADTAAFLEQSEPNITKHVVAAMFPNFAASCLGKMRAQPAAKLLNEMPISNTARIYRLLNQEKQQELSKLLTSKYRLRIRRLLTYSTLSAGDLMNPNVDMLLDNLTVADAIRRIARYQQPVKCEIFIVDQAHHFRGVVDLGKLIIAKQHVKLSDILSRQIRTLSVNLSSDRLLTHPGWANRQRLPVLDSDNTLVGILDYSRVKQISIKESETQDPMENLISLASLYWLSSMQLLESLLSIKVSKPRRK